LPTLLQQPCSAPCESAFAGTCEPRSDRFCRSLVALTPETRQRNRQSGKLLFFLPRRPQRIARRRYRQAVRGGWEKRPVRRYKPLVTSGFLIRWTGNDKRARGEWSCLNRSNRWLPRSCSHQGVSIGQEYGIEKRSDGGVPSFKSDRISLQIPSSGLKLLHPGRFFVILDESGLAPPALREESCVASSRILSRVRTDCRCDKIACCD